jgi:hypothetical protein
MNTGTIEGDAYIKYVDFSKAVLWKTKSLSIPPGIFDELKAKGIKTLTFIGTGKNKEVWQFSMADVDASKVLEKVGQEQQYYFPISKRIVVDVQKKLDGAFQ